MNKYQIRGKSIIMIKNILLTTFLLTAALNAQSNIGIDVNTEDVEVLGQYSFNSEIGYTGGTNFLVDASYLFSNENESNLFSVGVSAESSLEVAQGLTFGFGTKFVFAEDFMALPLLGRVAFILPFDSDIPTTSVKGMFAYAPSVLTFSDGENYLEYRLEADMEVISNIHIFTGYRNIDTNYEFIDYNLNDSFYGGLKLNF
jgi:hypothetical protein